MVQWTALQTHGRRGMLHAQWRRVSSPPPGAGAVLRLRPCGRERTTKMSLPRGTARSACASRAVCVHDRYENPVRSRSYRRLQSWYIVYTLYAVYSVLPYWYTYMYCPYPGNGIIVHQWLFLDAHSRKIIPSTMQLKTNSESH